MTPTPGTPWVSVLVTTYNQARYVEEALDYLRDRTSRDSRSLSPMTPQLQHGCFPCDNHGLVHPQAFTDRRNLRNEFCLQS
jgi:hypothetical protein